VPAFYVIGRLAFCCLCLRRIRLPSYGIHSISAGFDPVNSNTVDLYSSVSGTWSTAQLSVARTDVASTSVGNVAIFAGGLARDAGSWSTAQLRSNAVDLYNSASGTWSTAQLSTGRSSIVATSVGDVAIFAGGFTGDYRFAVLFLGLLLELMVLSTFAFCCFCIRRSNLLLDKGICRLLSL
jgi:hypothetical protein